MTALACLDAPDLEARVLDFALLLRRGRVDIRAEERTDSVIGQLELVDEQLRGDLLRAALLRPADLYFASNCFPLGRVGLNRRLLDGY